MKPKTKGNRKGPVGRFPQPAPKGNSYNRKFKTSGERTVLFKDLISHLEHGYDQRFFPACDWDTIELYCRQFPTDFPPDAIARAIRVGLLALEKMGHVGMMLGSDFNVRAWQFLMMNKTNYVMRASVESKRGKLEELSDEELGLAIEQIDRGGHVGVDSKVAQRKKEQGRKDPVSASAHGTRA